MGWVRRETREALREAVRSERSLRRRALYGYATPEQLEQARLRLELLHNQVLEESRAGGCQTGADLAAWDPQKELEERFSQRAAGPDSPAKS